MNHTAAAPVEKTQISPPTAEKQTETLVRSALDDIAVVIGGAATLHQLDDDLVWSVMRRLDRIRVRLLRDMKGLAVRAGAESSTLKPPRVHVAVDEFLARSRAGMGE